MSIPTPCTILWETMIEESDERFYVNDCKAPAFLILKRQNVLAKGNKHELLMTEVGRIGEYKTIRDTKEALLKVLRSSASPMKVYSQMRREERKRLFFWIWWPKEILTKGRVKKRKKVKEVE